MVLSGEPFSGFGFLWAVSPGAARPARRQPSSCRSRGLVSHCPTRRGARSANGGFSQSLLYRVNRLATILSSDVLSSSVSSNAFVKTRLEWYRQ